ncbi:MAG: F0F1 ATP synthase subunit delta [Gammaproteobacteria bacterium]|nr:F0F1 ATP synthase subunit delta [Gammaproteobacteria bacterium]NNF49244.1 F0F1 ATP synthase subunit delta [Woeseiaceae bacterium]MBT8093380.1 F0F1 ATP synthase subunit delta [Gammaproteobacteria bacterium]MBT8104079.1 F0F1 ATP synthase subunit delta [Gammaproteobacteria bacterium]NNK24094.1 F0F1 ATP synthase subunit delta [Woeseiaceae bacterium]
MADYKTVARPYAQAVFEVAQENDALDELSTSLAAAKALLEDGQIVAFLAAPTLSDDERLAFLQGLFADAVGEGSVFGGADKHGTNFLRLLLENDRVPALAEIADQFEALKAKIENAVDAVITSAAPLSEARQKEMVESLKARLGRDIRVTTEIDENLIGGAVIRAGDVVIDGSLRARLEGLANALTK